MSKQGFTSETTHPGWGCAYVSPDGVQCRGFAIRGHDRCIGHADESIKASASKKMRSAKRKGVLPNSIDGILNGNDWNVRLVAGLMKLIMKAVHQGLMEPMKANVLVNCGNTALRALDKVDLETRLEDLEKKFNEQEVQPWRQ